MRRRWAVLAAGMATLVAAMFVLGAQFPGTAPPDNQAQLSAGRTLPNTEEVLLDRKLPRDRAAFKASARSVQARATVRSLSSIQLAGPLAFAFDGAAADDTGDLGQGTLVVRGDRITVEGSGLSLTGTLVMSPRRAVLRAPAPGSLVSAVPGPMDTVVSMSQPATLHAENMTFQRRDGESVAVNGPVRLTPDPGQRKGVVYGENLIWVDAPDEIRLSGEPRSWVSWAGLGTVVIGAASPVSDRFGGVVSAGTLDCVVRRTGSSLEVEGETVVAQVYKDGLPQLTTRGSIQLPRAQQTHVVRPSSSGRFTWTVVNEGEFDMAIESIRPATDEARWVRLTLEPLPVMAGAERRPASGGHTAGFAATAPEPLRSVIPPQAETRRDIVYHVPSSTPPGRYTMRFIVSGNFPDIEVEIPVRVEA